MADKYLLTCMILDAYFQGKFYQKFISKVDSSFFIFCKFNSKENMLGGKHQLNVKGSLIILHAFKIHIGLSILMRTAMIISNK